VSDAMCAVLLLVAARAYCRGPWSWCFDHRFPELADVGADRFPQPADVGAGVGTDVGAGVG